jgi:acyl-CoA hydrolase
MREIIGAMVACLAVTSASACSSATTPPAEGNATLNYITSGLTRAIYGEGGKPEDDKYGGTVLDGTNGAHVSCSVRRSGSGYSVVGHIDNADMSIDVTSSDITACAGSTTTTGCASMSFFVQGRADAERSVDESNDPAPTCIVNVTQPNTKFVVKPGSIFASYDCLNVQASSNPGNRIHTQGKFLFTGCDK